MAAIPTALFPYVHTRPLINGDVRVNDVELSFVPMQDRRPPDVFREMAREMTWGIAEMGIAVAIATKEYNLPFTAIPVFTVRRFDYQVVHYNLESGINSPKDLEGKKIAGGSLQTDVDLHCSKMLADVYGVNLDNVSWVATRDNHIEHARLSKNAEYRPDATVNELLESGEVAACVAGYSGTSSKVRRLLDDTGDAEGKWLSRNHFPPLHHTVVISNELLRQRPSLADDLYAAFVEAKRPFLDGLADGRDLWPELSDSVLGPRHDFGVTSQSELILPDPIPYGIEANRGPIEDIIRIAFDRGYLSKAWTPEEVFATAG